MTSQDDFDRFVASQRGIRVKALRDLAKWWASVAHLSDDQIQARGERYVPVLARTYGELSATAAAAFYDAARGDSFARGRYTAQMAPSGAAEQAAAEQGFGWAAFRQGNPAAALDRLSGVVDAAALQDGRDTIVLNADRDKAGPSWARVPVGATCAWCLMLASRGSVYWTAASAGANKKFHRACDCQPVPTWDGGRDLPPSYNPERLYGLYRDARDNAGSGNPKAITAALRRLDGGKHVNDGVATVN